MIVLHRLSGEEFALNCDLIERIDATPDTVITMVDGKKYIVTENLHDVITAVAEYHSHVLRGGLCEDDPGALRPSRRHLAPVHLIEQSSAERSGREER